MATATFKPTSQSADDSAKLTVGEELIAATIAQAQAALWRAELSRCLLKLVVAAMVVTLAWVAIDQWVWSPSWPVRLAVLLSAVGAAAWWMAARIMPVIRGNIRADYAAQSLELDMPELRHQLASYISLRGDLATQGVRGAVVRSIGARAAGQIKQQRIEIPSEAAGTFTWWIVMAVMLAVFAAYTLLSPKNTLQSAQRLLLPLASIDAPSRVSITDVLPGDTEVLADRPVAISASIRGLSTNDEPVVVYGAGFVEQSPLAYDASTDRFVANVSVPHSTSYQLIAGDAVAGPFQIATRDVPVASVRQVEITPPTYTELPKRISTGGAITGEENSLATITTTINRPITRARIEFNPQDPAASSDAAVRIGPTAGGMDMKVADDGLSATVDITLRLPRNKSAAIALHSYRVRVWDADGNENPDPITYPVRIIRDLPPEVTIVQPRELTKELPINAQQLVEIAASDPDYGLRRVELVWQRGLDQAKTEILWSADKGERGNRVAEYRFRPEMLGLRVGDRVKVAAVALDNREDESGKYDPNRTVTQQVEWTIVEPRQLPPPTAPEDGVSETDSEPANSGDNDSQSGEQDGEKSGDGQSGGDGDGQSGSSDNADEQTEGKSGSSDSGESGDEAGEKNANKSDGKSGDGQGDESGDETSKSAMSKGNGNGAEPGAESGDEAGDNPANSEDKAQENGDQPTGDGDQSGKPGESKNDSNDTTTGAQQSGESPAEDSAQQADGKQGDQQTAKQNKQPQPRDGKSDSEQGEGSDSNQAPQHDGDAFEKIRDYLNKKKNETGSQKPQPSPQENSDQNKPKDSQPSGGNQDADDGRSGDKPEPSAQKDMPNDQDKAAGENQDNSGSNGDEKPPGSNPSTGKEKGEAKNKPEERSDASPAGKSKADDDKQGKSKQSEENPGTDAADGNSGKPSDGLAGDQKSGDQKTDDQKTDDQKTDDQKTGDQKAGDQKTGDHKAGDQKAGDQKASDQKASDQKASDQKASDQKASDQKASDQKASDQKNGDQKAGDQKAGDQKAGDQKAGDQKAGGTEPDGDGMPSESGSEGTADPSRPSNDRSSKAPSSQSTDGGDGNGNTSAAGSADSDGALPPEPVDVEYARKATDLVLDYLDQNRDTPDPELLERLNWTPEELRDFTERWKQLLKSQEGGAAGNTEDAKQVEETLRSLGIRPPNTGQIGQSRDRADTTRNLRDSGNRPAAPSIYRDAFEAFRRGVNRK